MKTINTFNNKTYFINEKISEGGEGEIFKATTTGNKNLYAIKLYNEEVKTKADKILSRISHIIRSSETLHKYPSLMYSIPLPIDIINTSEEKGYIMPFISKEHSISLEQMWYNTADAQLNIKYKEKLEILTKLSKLISFLHNSGLAHCDLSPRNVLYDTNKKNAILIDLDNLVVPKGWTGEVFISGTDGFIPPEFLYKNRNYANIDRIECDLHALAVIIFGIVCMRHPLIGQYVKDLDYTTDPSGELQRLAMAEEATFTDHPTITKNRDGKGVPINYIPEKLKNLFMKSFIDSLHKPKDRPRANEYFKALRYALNDMITCNHCGERFFREANLNKCPFCDKQYTKEKRIIFERYQKRGQSLIDTKFRKVITSGETLTTLDINDENIIEEYNIAKIDYDKTKNCFVMETKEKIEIENLKTGRISVCNKDNKFFVLEDIRFRFPEKESSYYWKVVSIQ